MQGAVESIDVWGRTMIEFEEEKSGGCIVCGVFVKVGCVLYDLCTGCSYERDGMS